MAVTGHKSVQSLSIYQRVSDKEKIKMADSLTENIFPAIPALQSCKKQAVMPGPSTLACTVTQESTHTSVRAEGTYMLSTCNINLELETLTRNFPESAFPITHP
jgi:hypothetical protein